MLTVSLDSSFVIATSVFANIYIEWPVRFFFKINQPICRVQATLHMNEILLYTLTSVLLAYFCYNLFSIIIFFIITMICLEVVGIFKVVTYPQDVI